MKKWIRVLLVVVVLGGLVGVPTMLLRSPNPAKRSVAPGTNEKPRLLWMSESPRKLTAFGLVGSDRVAYSSENYRVALITPTSGKTVRIKTESFAPIAAYAGDSLLLLTPYSVAAVDGQTLESVWSTELEIGEPKGISVSGNNIIAWSADSIWMLDSMGGVRWRATFAGGISGGVVLHHDVVFVVDQENRVIRLDAMTGRRTQEVKLDAPVIGPVYHSGNMMLLRTTSWWSSGPGLIALDPKTHKEIWRFNASMKGAWTAPVSAVCIEQGMAFFSQDQTLFAVNLQDGKQRWSRTFSERFTPGAPSCINGMVLSECGRCAMALSALDGHDIWSCDLAVYDYVQKWPRAPISPIRVGDIILFSNERRISVVELGSQQSKVAVGTEAVGCANAVGGLAAATLISLFVIALIFQKQRLFLASLSLLLCIATLFLWFNSFRAEHFVGYRASAVSTSFRSDTCRGIVSRFGTLSFGVRQRVWDDTIRRVVPISPRGPWCVTQEALFDPAFPVVTPPADLGLTNFGWSHSSRWSGTGLGDQVNKTLTVPHWVVVLFFAIWPLAWVTGLWRDRRHYPKGCCKKCGYDLRGGHEICPECGAPIGTATRRV